MHIGESIDRRSRSFRLAIAKRKSQENTNYEANYRAKFIHHYGLK
jgi:hypothetical protein